MTRDKLDLIEAMAQDRARALQDMRAATRRLLDIDEHARGLQVDPEVRERSIVIVEGVKP
jgi:hypothetical protein